MDDVLLDLGLALEMRNGDLAVGDGGPGRDCAPYIVLNRGVSAAASARFLPLCKIVGLSLLPAESSEGLPEIGYCEDYLRSLGNSNERGCHRGLRTLLR